MKNRSAILSFCFATLLWSAYSCQSKQQEQPSLPDEKLARIMADLSIADAATNGLGGYRKDSLMHVYTQQVFEVHQTTLETYEKDMKILSLDLERMENVVKRAEEMLTEPGTRSDRPGTH